MSEAQEKVKSLTLGLFKIEFRDKLNPKEPLPDNTLVEDYGAPLIQYFPWEPCYYMRGWFHKIDHGARHRFFIDANGPDKLIFTLREPGLSLEDLGHIKSRYTEAWRDNNNHYLLQVI